MVDQRWTTVGQLICAARNIAIMHHKYYMTPQFISRAGVKYREDFFNLTVIANLILFASIFPI